LEAEFRSLCKAQADKLEAELSQCGPSRAATHAMPPVVDAALRLAQAAEQVTGQAVMDPNLSPAVKGQLSNLTTVASYMTQAAPGGTGKTEAPSVAGIRALPDKQEARWNPNLLLQAG